MVHGIRDPGMKGAYKEALMIQRHRMDIESKEAWTFETGGRSSTLGSAGARDKTDENSKSALRIGESNAQLPAVRNRITRYGSL